MDSKPTDLALPAWLLPVVSWAVSLYFVVDIVRCAGFWPTEDLLIKHAPLTLALLFFLFLPFFTKVKIGKLLELERDVAKTKDDVAEFKAEVRNTLSIISTNINTISAVSNQVTVNLPNPNEIRELRHELEDRSEKQLTKPSKQDDMEELLQREDPTLALAWTRIEMERLLRRILGRRTHASSSEPKDIKFASLPQLFNSFTALNPGYRYLNDAFHYVTNICNAAIHAQNVSPAQAREALGLGRQVILILRNLAGEATGLTQEGSEETNTN
jgi:hypothetical protein